MAQNPTSTAPTVEPTRQVTLGNVRWNSAFEFTLLFKGFRLATNPAKLFIALMAIFVVYGAGRVFDMAWGPQVVANEIERFQSSTSEEFGQYRRAMATEGQSHLEQLLAETQATGDVTRLEITELAKHPRAAYGQIKTQAIARFHDRLKRIHEARVQEEETRATAATANSGMRFVRENVPSPAEMEQQRRRDTARELQRLREETHVAAGRGIFESLMHFEIQQFDALLDNTLSLVRVSPVQTNQLDGVASIGPGLVSKNPDRIFKSDTVISCIVNMTITGPQWLFTAAGPMQYRPDNVDTWGGWLKMMAVRGGYLLSLLALAGVFLGAVAFSGSFVCRFSALEFAGVERPLIKDVFAFSAGKFWTFVTAPLTPFAILLVIGLVMAGAGFIGAVPVVGEVLLGAGFFLFLAGGFLLMLVSLGILGGYNLIYPTIAAEGSDTFDAMSRAFAYVYARPWRLAFYTVVVLIYGAVTTLFVGFGIYILLALTHVFAGWGTSVFGHAMGAYSGQAKMDTLWPMPHFNRLAEPVEWWSLSWSEAIGAGFLRFWVFSLISVIGAYVVSYYHSSQTIIYFLLRRSVEGQSLTEVYQEDAQPSVAAPAATTEPSAPAAAPSAAEPSPPASGS